MPNKAIHKAIPALVLGLALFSTTAHAVEAVAVSDINAPKPNYSLQIGLADSIEKTKTLTNTVIVLQDKIKQLEAEAATCTGHTVTVNTPSGGGGGGGGGGGSASQSCQFSSAVCSFYQSTTGGLPESEGAAYWQGELNKLTSQGLSESQALAQIKDKAALLPEVVSHAGTSAVDASRNTVSYSGSASSYGPTQTTSNNAASTNNQLQSLYQNTMGRGADAAGMAYWQDQINSGQKSIYDVQQYMQTCKANGTCS